MLKLRVSHFIKDSMDTPKESRDMLKEFMATAGHRWHALQDMRDMISRGRPRPRLGSLTPIKEPQRDLEDEAIRVLLDSTEDVIATARICRVSLITIPRSLRSSMHLTSITSTTATTRPANRGA